MSVSTRTNTPLGTVLASWGAQRALGERLGVSPTTVSKWANGLRPGPRNRRRIARVLVRDETPDWRNLSYAETDRLIADKEAELWP